MRMDKMRSQKHLNIWVLLLSREVDYEFGLHHSLWLYPSTSACHSHPASDIQSSSPFTWRQYHHLPGVSRRPHKQVLTKCLLQGWVPRKCSKDGGLLSSVGIGFNLRMVQWARRTANFCRHSSLMGKMVGVNPFPLLSLIFPILPWA